MKRIVLAILVTGLFAGYAFADPTPTPVPSPTPVAPAVDAWQKTADVNLYYEFATDPETDVKLNSVKTRTTFTVPGGWTLYITDIEWSCQSATQARLEWDDTVDVLIDKVHFTAPGQGKCIGYTTSKFYYTAGVSPVFSCETGANGVVFVNGFLQ